ncbi:MAG: 30S ribosomal protein S20 [Planctomycetes bacterium]|nr:30S ribosomal protein S20 [Planctomycetota bacterium]
MAHTLSGVRNIRRNEKSRLRNKTVKSALRTQMKKVLTSVGKKDKDASKRELQEAYRLLDKAVAKGVIHRNNASRHKSRLSVRVAALG